MIELVSKSIIATLVIILLLPFIGFIIDNIIKLLASILSKYTSVKFVNFILNRLTFIGTVHHELSHALIALLTGAKIIKIDLFKPEGNTLGKVIFQPRGNKILQSIQVTLSAIAPVILGLFSIYLLTFKLLALCTKIWQIIIVIYLIISIFVHTTMSKQDIISGLKGLPICGLIIFILNILFNLFNGTLI